VASSENAFVTLQAWVQVECADGLVASRQVAYPCILTASGAFLNSDADPTW
jgi:hypothetical protein